MKKIIILIVVFISSTNFYSQKPFIPEPTLKVVSDFENLLSEEEQNSLANDIKKEYDSNSNQLMVVAIPTSYLGNLTIEDYTQLLFEKWQPGQKNLNNGVILIIAGSKTDSVGRKLRIHTGYGIEGVLPDILCSRIERELMVPELKKGNYYKAIKNGCSSILNFIGKENMGTKPKFKIEVLKGTNLVYDYARIFSDEQIEILEKKLKKGFNNKRKVIVTNLDYNTEINSAYVSTSYEGDTSIIEIGYNPGYYINTSDSSMRFDETHKAYALNFSGDYDEFDYGNFMKLLDVKDSLVLCINNLGINVVTTSLIDRVEKCYWDRIKRYEKFFGGLFLITVIMFILFQIAKGVTHNYKLKKNLFIKVGFGIILTINNLYSLFSLLTVEMLYYFTFVDFVALLKWQIITVLIILAISHILNMYFVYKINNYFFDSKLFAWLGKTSGGSTYSSSSSSSSSSSYLSSSSYSSSSGSSSSNSGYYGGGGKSGGGGASSDW